MTWTTPGYVASGEADSGKFNTETVDNLQHLYDFVAGGGATWAAPTLTNAWVNFGGGYQTVRYTKVAGIVHVQGAIKNGTIGAAAFTLPAGFRPAATLVFASVDGLNGIGRVDITSAGAVTPAIGNNAFYGVNLSFVAA